MSKEFTRFKRFIEIGPRIARINTGATGAGVIPVVGVVPVVESKNENIINSTKYFENRKHQIIGLKDSLGTKQG
jgi:hypothetical protein